MEIKKKEKMYMQKIEKSKECPLISVILPTYNREKKITASIQSILEQTYKNIELIIVDDCSKDQSIEVIQEITDSRIRLIRNEKNEGPAKSRNIGVSYAKSEVIAFNDSDDIWHKDKLVKQMSYWREHPDKIMLYSRYNNYMGREVGVIPAYYYEKSKLEGDIFYSLLEGNKVGTPTILMKKKVFEDLKGFDTNLKALEDWDLAIRVAHKGEIGFIEESLVNAYGEKEGINSNMDNLINAQIEIIAKNCINEKSKIHLKDSVIFLLERIVKYTRQADRGSYEKRIIPRIVENKLSYELLIDTLQKKVKMEENYHLLTVLIEKEKVMQRIHTYFKTQNWNKLAIYGYGKVGKIFVKMIQDTDLEICYIIDRSKVQEDGIVFKSLEEIDSKPNVIIVTTPIAYNEMSEKIGKFSNSIVKYIGEIIQ